VILIFLRRESDYTDLIKKNAELMIKVGVAEERLEDYKMKAEANETK
jgi:hypothetical protein